MLDFDVWRTQYFGELGGHIRVVARKNSKELSLVGRRLPGRTCLHVIGFPTVVSTKLRIRTKKKLVLKTSQIKYKSRPPSRTR